ncbi:MAG: RecX family transcriptional regulator [Clostridia bacterium]|jgi:regulatory protein|nr:RecX family transcriptional regulator [Clostridia bacterium]
MYSLEEFDEQKTKVMKYIVFKKRTEQEVRTKFANLIEPNMLEDIIEYLKEAQYLNDKEYIEKTINNFKILKNLSLKEVKYKLLAKGLNKDDIEDYFYEHKEELNEYEQKSAKNIFYKKQRDMEQDEIKQYLLKKGYKLENIKFEE